MRMTADRLILSVQVPRKIFRNMKVMTIIPTQRLQGDKLLSNSIIQKMKSFQIRKSEKHLHGWIAPALTVGEKSLREEAGDPLKDLKKDLDKSGKTAKDILIEGMKELGLGDDPSKLDVTYSLAGTSDWFHTFGEYLQQMYKETLGINLKIDHIARVRSESDFSQRAPA